MRATDRRPGEAEKKNLSDLQILFPLVVGHHPPMSPWCDLAVQSRWRYWRESPKTPLQQVIDVWRSRTNQGVTVESGGHEMIRDASLAPHSAWAQRHHVVVPVGDGHMRKVIAFTSATVLGTVALFVAPLAPVVGGQFMG